MKLNNKLLLLLLLLVSLAGQLSAQTRVVPAGPQEGPILLEGATIHIGNGEVIENGVLGFAEGKITVVGEAGDNIPNQAQYEVINVAGKHIYPGLIAIACDLGLAEVSAVRATLDYAELGDFNPNVRSLVAYNTDSELIPTFRYNGILLAQTTPRSGVIHGTSSVVQLDAWNWEDAAYVIDDAVHMSWPAKEYGPRWWLGETENRKNENYGKIVQMIESTMADAQAYSQIESPEEMNLKLEALKGLFDGSKGLFIHTDDAKAMLVAIQTARQAGVQRIVIVGGYEALLVKDYLKSEQIPVVLDNVHRLPRRDHEDTVFPYKMAKEFHDAGIEIALSGGNGYAVRNMPFYAGTAVAYGLPYEEAIKAMTLSAAKVLGIDDRVGSLESGKDAMLIVAGGDLLDMRSSKVEHAFIQGRRIQLEARQQWLYKKYSEKYGHTIDD